MVNNASNIDKTHITCVLSILEALLTTITAMFFLK